MDLESLLRSSQPVLALAPMQDVTDWAFLRLLEKYGGADLYYTEYFRVYPGSLLNKTILKSITENPTSKPVIAQLIGNEIAELTRTARELQAYPVAGIDLNLGCPAPVVYKKCAGGGLLRDPEQVDRILGALRDVTRVPFTVKTRLGFDSKEGFESLLPIFNKHSIDLLTVHGRTVKEMYRSEVHHEYIRQAVGSVNCPVLANGNVYSADKGARVLEETGARGLMIGRGAIRNPWIFEQCRQRFRGEPVRLPVGREVLDYIRALFDACCVPEMKDSSKVQRLKKHMNYLGMGIEPTGDFLHRIRRVSTTEEFFKTCEGFLDHTNPMPLEPYFLDLGTTDVMAGVQT
jgi:nifR3 family TIM-barrel protein